MAEIPPSPPMAEAQQETHQGPLSLQAACLQFKFHILLECPSVHLTTLDSHLLTFITKNQTIFQFDGEKFEHPLTKHIWNMVVKCTELGDGFMTTMLVPVNPTNSLFDWKVNNPTMKQANLWVRVFEVGSVWVAKEEDIKSVIYMAKRNRQRWMEQEQQLKCMTTGLDSYDLMREVLGVVDVKVADARKAVVDLCKAWMRPTNIG